MTMDANSSDIEFLALRVLASKEAITYHMLSRELGIHSNNAKQILYDFYKSNRDKLTASFIITGSKDGKTVIKLSEELSLSQDCNDFSQVSTVHIYCVWMKLVPVSNNEIAFAELKYSIDHSRLDDYVKNGLIRGPELKVMAQVKETKQTQREKETAKESRESRDSKSVTPKSEKKETKSAGISSGYVSRKAPVKKQTASLLSFYTSRKKENDKEKVKEQPKESKEDALPEKRAYQYKSRKEEKKEPKERVTMSNDQGEDVEEEPEPKKAKISTSELENLFLDDFSDDEKQEEEEQPIHVEEENAKEKVDDMEEDKVNEEKENEKKENEDKMEEEQEQEEEGKQQSEEVDTNNLGNSGDDMEEDLQQTVDEDGYITTRKKKPEVKPKPRQPTRPIKKIDKKVDKKSDKGKKQTSLMNFFQSR